MDEKLHRKAYDEGRKTAPKVFNPDFNKHMKKVVVSQEKKNKAAFEKRKISLT